MDHRIPLYLIPGLGADKRLYSGLRLSRFDIRVIEWIEPTPDESFSDYLRRLIAPVEFPAHFYLGGVSLGGIAAVELERILNPRKMLLISTVLTSDEIPAQLKMLRYIELHKIVSKKGMERTAELLDNFMLTRSERHRDLFLDMLHHTSEEFLRFGADAVVRWNNKIPPQNYLRLHGENDLVFPVKQISGAITIPNGTHFMIVEKAAQLSRLVDCFL